MRDTGLAGLFYILLAAGCSASWYEARADESGDAIVSEKTGDVDRFRSKLLDPRGEVPHREPFAPPIEVPEIVTLDNSISIATRYNRNYKTQRENFFILALGLDLTRRDFTQFVFTGNLSYFATDGRRIRLSDASILSLSGTRFLPTGGRFTVTTSGALETTSTDSGRVQDTNVAGSIQFSQPILRGAGKKVAYEPLKQAERNALYEARQFEQFRETFAIDVISRYYDLVRQKRALVNTRANLKNQDFTYNQARALHRIGQGSRVDVSRAEQSLLNARDSILDDEQAYQVSLDRFKIFLGLPTDSQFDVADEFPSLVELDVDMERAVTAALKNRLDLATSRDVLDDARRRVYVARNNLLPDLDVFVTYNINSAGSSTIGQLIFDNDNVNFGVDLEIPLDRRAERNAYRTSLISLDRAHRDLSRAEDTVIVQIRDGLRGLRTLRSKITIEDENLKSLRRQARQAEIENRAGLVDNRDVVEALDNFTAAENQQLRNYVDYEIARLRIIQQLGLMFIDQGGRIVS